MRGLPSLAFCAALSALAAFGCAAPEDEDDAAARSDVTDIPQTTVKAQQVGNCWIYTTVAWAESLHLSATREQLDLSESWLTYWFYYEQVADPSLLDRLLAPDAIAQAGDAGIAFELIGRYGLVPETSFRTAAPTQALTAFQDALRRGDLSTRAARNDPARVRRALDRAFGLDRNTVAAMTAVFGADGKRDLDSADAAARSRLALVRAGELRVRLPHPETHAAETRTLADAIGTGDPRYAWRSAIAPVLGSDRDWLRRIQRALHDGYPMPLVWYVDFASQGPDQITFRPPAEGMYGTAGGGWHLSLLSDYGAANVPGFGALPVGRTETRSEALAAALDERTEITVLRVKNSWGLRGLTFDPLKLEGYSDLTRAYYTQRGPWTPAKTAAKVTLPPGY